MDSIKEENQIHDIIYFLFVRSFKNSAMAVTLENSTLTPETVFLHETDLTLDWLLNSLRNKDQKYFEKFGNMMPRSVSFLIQ